MKNKKSVMAVSALLILMFHCWVNIGGRNSIENFVRQTAYLGVDMFFFVSAYTIGMRRITDCKAFLWSRVTGVYFKFVFWALVAVCTLQQGLGRFLRIVSGVELFTKGGGAFLWFLPAIMLFYIWICFYESIYNKWGKITILYTAVAWVVISLLVMELTDYRSMFIFWNRLPIFMLGYHLARRDSRNGKVNGHFAYRKFILGIVLLIPGLFLVWKWGYQMRLQVPICDMYYILVIPAAVACVLLSSCIRTGRILNCIGSVTLEMYAIQMLYGTRLANYLYKKTQSPWMTNLGVLVVVVLAAIVIGDVSFVLRSAHCPKKRPLS